MLKNSLIKKGNVAQLLQMAVSALLTQKGHGFSAEETVMRVQENFHLQSFI